jgi:diguanylate cyclase (GGDEF)-like protein
MALIIGDLATQQVRRQIGLALEDLAVQMADRLDQEMATRIAEVDVLSGLPVFARLEEPSRQRAAIDSLQDSLPIFSWVGVVDRLGTVVAGTGGVLEGRSIAERPVFQEGIGGGFVGDVHDAVMLASLIPNPTGEPIKFVDISRPIIGPNGELRGVLATHLSWQWARLVERRLLLDRGSDGNVDLYVVASDKTILLGPDTSLHGRDLDLTAIDEATSGAKGWRVETWSDGQEYLVGYAKADGEGAFEGLGWVVLARQPLAEAFAPVKGMVWQIALLGLMFTVAGGVIGWIMTARIVKPLNEMADAADALRVDEAAGFPRIRGPQEIETVSHAFEDLIETLVAKRGEIAALSDKAYRDPLTGLSNRAALDEFLKRPSVQDRAFAVLAIDLDNFKGVNDSFGHDTGDRLLQVAAIRLKGCVRSGDLLVRTGGDEFLAVLVMVRNDQDGPVRRIAARVVKDLSAPYDVIATRDGKEADLPAMITISASAGLACYPRDGETLEEVMKHADECLYQAKEAGKARVMSHGQKAPISADAAE